LSKSNSFLIAIVIIREAPLPALSRLARQTHLSIINLEFFYSRNCSSGEGIFTFYAPRAREIVSALELATKAAVRQPMSAVEGKKAGKMNPLLGPML
jgi:hypothetical protein